MSGQPNKLPVWHEGERLIQERLGVAGRMAEVGARVIRDHMPDQHRAFYAQLPFIVVGSVDDGGDAWATILEGQPGFMASPTPKRLDIAARPQAGDPAAPGIGTGRPLGLLGIEMHSRRRNRMNGTLTGTDSVLRVDVDQSFGNCPRYIQLRDAGFARDVTLPHDAPVESLAALDQATRAMIATADSFFVASYADRDGQRQVDVSHRGGKAGFVRADADGVLTIPDFDGNLFFNTLGNILLNGKAGLLFVDHASGDMLQMTGDAEILFDSPEIEAFQGAERLWTFRPSRIVLRRGVLALRWAFRGEESWSPHALMTGDWTQAAERLRAAALSNSWRPLRVARIVDESSSIRSFHLLADDGAGLLPHRAGQHLPIRVTLPGSDRPLIRTYTISTAPSDEGYRISVKRDGAVSRYLHDRIAVGDMIEARRPSGDFTIDARGLRPAVLLAGGVGITPMMAMARHVVFEGVRRQAIRPIFLFHAARSLAERPFDRELDALVDASYGSLKLIRILSQTDGAREGVDYDAAGRIDMALLSRFLPFGDYDFHLCGPSAFTQGLYDGLRQLNIADDRIHAETFGPSSLQRTAEEAASAASPASPPSTKPVAVAFMDSLKEARWTPGAGTLLDLAEARGLNPEFGCREGSCGTCKSRLLRGAVTHIRTPGIVLADDELLLCSAVPAEAEGDTEPSIQLAL
ncbi:MAG: pyridoxamine 5'-phosphate oxidase family protein [Pseudomonadota bacterium]